MSFFAPLMTYLGGGAAVSSVAVPVGTFSAAGGLAGATITGATAATTGLSAASILGLVGTGLNAIGQIQAGQAQQDAANYNAQIARQNAVLARQQAEEEERRFRVTSRKELGAMRTGYGASGVTLEGSPMDILEDAAYIAEIDALTIRQGGRQKAMSYTNQARLDKLRGKTQKKQAYFGAASTALMGGSKYWPT